MKHQKKSLQKNLQNNSLKEFSNFQLQQQELRSFRLDQILIFLIILFLPTQLGRHFWPDFSYVSSLKIDYYSPTIYFWDLLLIITITYFLWKKLSFNKTALTLAMIFLLTQAVSLISTTNIGPGLVRLEQLLIVSIFGVLIASLDLKGFRNVIFWGLSLGVMVESLISVLQFLFSRSLGFWILGERSFSLSTLSIANFNFYGQIFLRPYGTFPHPNVMSAFMILCIPLVYFLGKARKDTQALSIISASISTLLSFSRGAILILGVEILFFLRKHLKVLAILLLVTLPILYVRFASAFNFDSLSFTRREELAELSISLFLQNPIFGIGLNNFIFMSAEAFLISGPTRFLQPVHNIFLLEAAEVGILGLVGFLGFLVYPLYKLWQQRKDYFSKILFFELFVIILLGMIDHYFLTLPQGQRMLFLIWGLSLANIKSLLKRQ